MMTLIVLFVLLLVIRVLGLIAAFRNFELVELR